MRSIAERRKAFMDYLTSTLDILDPSGDNSKAYHDLLDPMSDTQFDKWAENFFADKKKNLYLEIVEYERDLKLENIEKCAEHMNIPLFERVARPDITSPGSPAVVSPEPVAVGYIHEKRMQQTLMKKSAGSISVSKRNPKSGQVIKQDKNARTTDVETYAMIAQNAVIGLQELMGPRADDEQAKTQLFNAISAKGYATLEDIEDDRYNKTSLNTFDVYYLLQGISTNVVTPLDVIPGPRIR